MIQTLIDKQDTIEIIRDKIALILATESASQQQLATTAGKDPSLWAFKVYTERTRPWEFLRSADDTPIVNVWFDNSSLDNRASQTIDRQQYEATFNIDVIASGVTEILPAGAGQTTGDENAARNAQRVARLVRNIIAADTYVALGIQRSLGLVGGRYVSTVQSYQPAEANNAYDLAAVRIALRVKISESAPQTPAVILEELTAIFRDEDGAIIVDADYVF